VVSPNNHILDVLNRRLQFFTQLRECAVLIQAGQGGEVFLGDGRSVVRSNESVSVGRVTHNENLHILLRELVEGLTLSLEDLGVLVQEIFALHAGASWLGTDEHSNISLSEGLFNLSCGNDTCDKGECTILELEDKTLKESFGSRKLKELKDHFLVGSKHSSLSSHEA
jgi:hypothetical protein